jgi:hypothetical protein
MNARYMKKNRKFPSCTGYIFKPYKEIFFYTMALSAHSGPKPLIQFPNHFSQTVRLLPWTSDQPVARPLPAHRINADIDSLSWIRTHDPTVRASEGSSCLKLRGYYDRQKDIFSAWKIISKVPAVILFDCQSPSWCDFHVFTWFWRRRINNVDFSGSLKDSGLCVIGFTSRERHLNKIYASRLILTLCLRDVGLRPRSRLLYSPAVVILEVHILASSSYLWKE